MNKMFQKIDEHDIKIARDAIEKILFGSDRLNKLKEKVSDLEKGIINGTELKKTILLEFGEAIDEISEFLPFYVEHLMNNKSLENHVLNDDHVDLRRQLEEKDALIKEKNEFIVEIVDRTEKIFREIEAQST